MPTGVPTNTRFSRCCDRQYVIVGQAVLFLEFFRAAGSPVNDTAIASADPEISLGTGKSGDRNIPEIRVKRTERAPVVTQDTAFRKSDQKDAGGQY